MGGSDGLLGLAFCSFAFHAHHPESTVLFSSGPTLVLLTLVFAFPVCDTCRLLIDRALDAFGEYYDRGAAPIADAVILYPLSSLWHARKTHMFVDLSSMCCQWLAGAFQPR